MALFKISQDDINRRKSPEKGWHFGIIRKYSEKADKSKTGVNYTFELEILDTAAEKSNVGKFFYKLFSSKAPGFFIPFYAAAMEMKEEEVNAGDVNLDVLIERKLWFEVVEEVDSQNGRINKNTESFQPATAQPPF